SALKGVDTIVCLVGTTRAQFRPAKDGEPEVSYETVDIGIPRALSIAGKRAAEAAVKDSGLAWVFLRPSFIVGPGRAAPKALDVVWAPVRLFAKGVADDMPSF